MSQQQPPPPGPAPGWGPPQSGQSSPQPARAHPGGPPPGPGAPGPFQPGPLGQPPGGPGGRRTGRVVALLLVLAVVGVGAFVLLSGDDDGDGGGGGGPGGGGGGPEGGAARFVEAALDGDCDTVRETLLVPDEMARRWDEACAELVEGFDRDADHVPVELLSTRLVDESGDEATVEVEYRTRGGGTRTDELDVVRRGDRWLVDLVFDPVVVDGPVGPGDLDGIDDEWGDPADRWTGAP